MIEYCIYCGEEIVPSDERVEKMFGAAHFECSETEDPEELD